MSQLAPCRPLNALHAAPAMCLTGCMAAEAWAGRERSCVRPSVCLVRVRPGATCPGTAPHIECGGDQGKAGAAPGTRTGSQRACPHAPRSHGCRTAHTTQHRPGPSLLQPQGITTNESFVGSFEMILAGCVPSLPLPKLNGRRRLPCAWRTCGGHATAASQAAAGQLAPWPGQATHASRCLLAFNASLGC